jgi:hypothetical protein
MLRVQPGRTRRHQSLVIYEPPATPSCQGQRQQDREGPQRRPSPTHPVAHRAPAPLYVFRKRNPLRVGCTGQAAVPATLLESPHPYAFVQLQRGDVAAHKAFAEHPARDLGEVACLNRTNIARRHLGGLADCVDGEPSTFAFPTQLIAECRHSALSRYVPAKANLPLEYAIRPAESKYLAELPAPEPIWDTPGNSAMPIH